MKSKNTMVRDIMTALEIVQPDMTTAARAEYRRHLQSLDQYAVKREWREKIPEDIRYMMEEHYYA